MPYSIAKSELKRFKLLSRFQTNMSVNSTLGQIIRENVISPTVSPTLELRFRAG